MGSQGAPAIIDAARAARVLLGAEEPVELSEAGLVDALRSLLASPTFPARVLWSLQAGDLHGRLLGEHMGALAVWVASAFPLSSKGRRLAEGAGSRGDLLRIVLADEQFRSAVPQAASAAVDAALSAVGEVAPQQRETVALVGVVRDHDAVQIDAFARSVFALDEDDWELCLCDNGSTLLETGYALDRLRGADARVRIGRLEEQASEAAALADAARGGSGRWAWTVDVETPLHPDVLAATRRAGLQPRVSLLTR